MSRGAVDDGAVHAHAPDVSEPLTDDDIPF
jgi:hypothetical protein